MKLDLDLNKLPKEYHFNKESLSENKYIDDNSLFVYQLLRNGTFSVRSPEMNFLYFKPFEWTSIDFIAFLLSVSKEYGLEIRNIQTNMSPIKEDYEVSLHDENGQPIPQKIIEYRVMVGEAMMRHNKLEPFVQPKWYEGAYKWILNKKEKDDKSEEIELFEKFSKNIATVADLERALLYANRTLPLYEKMSSERFMSKEFFGKIIDWTTFLITMTDEQKSKISSDVDRYMEAFMQDKLERNSIGKRINDTTALQSQNIFTFKKHYALFREYLQKMHDDFGRTISIENTFEDGFVDYKYTNPETIRIRYTNRNFYFIHTLFAFKSKGLIKMLSLGSNWHYTEDKPLSYQAKVEILEPFFNEEASIKLAFDADKSRFFVQGKSIKLLKFKNEYHTLRVMFENSDEVSKEWYFSEIAERVDTYASKDKKYYNAIYQIGLKLEKEGIKDFFITTKQSVKISPKYLS